MRYSSGDYAEAERIFREAMGASPHIPVLGYNLGMSLRAQGKEEGETLVATYEALMARSCPYFDGRLLRDSLETAPLAGLAGEEFDAMLEEGYRRTGDRLSRNVCSACSDCIQMRIDLRRFLPSRSQRRSMKRNADLELSVALPVVDGERTDLYEKYLRARHGWTEANYRSDLEESSWSWPGSAELSFRLDGRLVCSGILDRGKESLYSALCYFDPDMPKRRLGILSLTCMALWGKEKGFRWLYTGEYLENKANMRYKKAFGPRQDFVEGAWTEKGG